MEVVNALDRESEFVTLVDIDILDERIALRDIDGEIDSFGDGLTDTLLWLDREELLENEMEVVIESHADAV